MKNKILIFDLDATLYYVGDKIEKRFDDKATSYFADNLNVSKEKAWEIIVELRKKYYYECDGFFENFSFSKSDFMEYACDVSTEGISKDKELDYLLKQISNVKYILTDSTQKHSKDVLNKMQVDYNNFAYIYDAHDMNYIFKYCKECFESFLSKFNLKAKDCIMFEDSIKNLKSAKSCGMTTVYITPKQTEKPEVADYLFSDIKTALKELFQL